MPKKKKPSRNGYWEFAIDCRDKNPGRFKSNEDLQNYASVKWANMSKDDKHVFEVRAQLARDNQHRDRFTTDGEKVEELERQVKEAENRSQVMKNEISKKLKSANYEKNLDEEIFLIIHINHLVYVPASDRYHISEIAISALSLRNGIEDVYHSLVHPGTLPLGFSGTAIAHSKETHQLYDVVVNGKDNTPEVFRDMTDFIKKYSKYGTEIVYADEKTFEMITKVLNMFQEDFQYPGDIKVYNLQYLFFTLRNTVAGRPVWPTETYSFNELDKDVYSYTPNISCEYHEVSDISVYCSKSIVIRYGYTICDHCCADLNIQVLPGFHVPAKSKVAASRTASHVSSTSKDDEFRPNRSRSGTSFSSYDNNYPPLSSARSAASSVRSFSTMKAGPSSSGSTAARLQQSFKTLSVKEVDKRNRGKFPEHGQKQP